MSEPRTIALDIGGVCISLHHGKCLERLGLPATFIPPPEFMELCGMLETGRVTEAEWFDSFHRLLEGRFSKEELRDAWNLILGSSLPGMAELVRESAGNGFRFAYLSDTSKLHMDHFFRVNDFCHLVSGGVFSYEVGERKPGSAMYEEFERRYGVPCLYVDDRPCNIEAARERGWRAEVFESADALRRMISCSDSP